MPELPEVETVRRGLEALVVGQSINKVDVLNDKSFIDFKHHGDDLVLGQTIVSVRRRAKMLIIDLSNGYSLLIHLKMTGQLVYRGDKSWAGGHPNDSFLNALPDKSTRVEFYLSNDSKLFFNDQRKFGWIKLFATNSIPELKFIAKLGPEPLSGHPENEFVARLSHHPKTTIKAAILNQEVLAGVGNIYADESLWLSKIHPSTKVGQLDEVEQLELLKNIQQVMIQSIAAGGSTARNYVKADGSKGDYLDKFAAVYNRTGQKCLRCGKADIIKIRVAGRGTHICPNCQIKKADTA